ncbi:MAG: amidohydrolase family protein [Actinobacteria bacterium]|nr:amidohydrolase family protein [Actinomycetota bacterium]MBV9253045.1 amidohydrolase family protein [Actinomycetota bacterium]
MGTSGTARGARVPTYDLVVRGGTVIDGTGGKARSADVAVKDGVVVAVGDVDGTAERTIDADGALVTPGFVDIHTHYDGQATWDNQLLPSSWHGVTTVVMGNCGVGFAPVRPSDHQRLIELMEGVEDIPGAALHEGLSWDWQTFPEYLDALERLPHDIDFAAQVPHGAVRLHVMGERGANREVATPEEIEAMGRIVREAVEAGALGFTTSRTLNHRTSRGEPTPTLTAAADELIGIAAAMGKSGAGVLEVVSDFIDAETEWTTLRGMVEASGRPLSISVAAQSRRPGTATLLDLIGEAADAGLPIKGQVAARAIGVLLGLQATLNPFLGHETYKEIAGLSLEERVRIMRDPSFKEKLLSSVEPEKQKNFLRFSGGYERLFELSDPPDYEPSPDQSIGARARREGREADELVYELMLEDDGRRLLYMPIFNYGDGDLEACREMLLHDHSVPGLGDGGAHVGTICDGSFPTTLLTHWGRDRSRGERIDLEFLVSRQTRETAAHVGLHDRGVLAPGKKADINVIDFDQLTLHPPTMSFDLPAGGKRLLQRADGYLHTIVSGTEVYANGEHTGALPGKLVRGAQPA